MAKKKATKAKNKNQLVEQKKEMIQKHWNFVHAECEEFEIRLNKLCDEQCNKISKLYEDKLKKLPEHIRNMTLTEYLEMQQKTEAVEMQQQLTEGTNCVSLMRSQYEKSKLESEKKKTLKKRKRSCSVSSIFSANKGFPPTLASANRTMSESCLGTPLMKRSAPSMVVTPKFNPRVPINKVCMRRPRVGEVVMSLSGSPLHNIIDDIAHKPGVSFSLGGGNVINITEDTEIEKLERDIFKKLDEETLSSLANVKHKLDLILKKS